MKCDELKAYKADVTIPVYGTIADAEVYLKDNVNAAIEELKTALNESEEARYEAGADAADYYQENRRLKRALWLSRALRARDKAFEYHFKNNVEMCAKWDNVHLMLMAKAEEYK